MLEKGKKRTRKPAPPKPPPPHAAAPQVIGSPAAASQAAASKAPPKPAARPGPISAEERRHMVAEAAYFRAQRRGFRVGDPDLDWTEAEAEIDALLLNRR